MNWVLNCAWKNFFLEILHHLLISDITLFLSSLNSADDFAPITERKYVIYSQILNYLVQNQYAITFLPYPVKEGMLLPLLKVKFLLWVQPLFLTGFVKKLHCQ